MSSIVLMNTKSFQDRHNVQMSSLFLSWLLDALKNHAQDMFPFRGHSYTHDYLQIRQYGYLRVMSVVSGKSILYW